MSAEKVAFKGFAHVLAAFVLITFFCASPDVYGAQDSAPTTSSVPGDVDLATKASSATGAFLVEYKVVGAMPPLEKLHDWLISVTDAQGVPAEHIKLAIKNYMPGHEHEIETIPQMTGHIRGGKHLIEGMYFTMPGWWVIRVSIVQGDLRDQVEFNLLLP